MMRRGPLAAWEDAVNSPSGSSSMSSTPLLLPPPSAAWLPGAALGAGCVESQRFSIFSLYWLESRVLSNNFIDVSELALGIKYRSGWMSGFTWPGGGGRVSPVAPEPG